MQHFTFTRNESSTLIFTQRGKSALQPSSLRVNEGTLWKTQFGVFSDGIPASKKTDETWQQLGIGRLCHRMWDNKREWHYVFLYESIWSGPYTRWELWELYIDRANGDKVSTNSGGYPGHPANKLRFRNWPFVLVCAFCTCAVEPLRRGNRRWKKFLHKFDQLLDIKCRFHFEIF